MTFLCKLPFRLIFFILQPSDMPAKKRRRSRGITVSKPDTEMEYASKEQRGTEFPLSYRQFFSSSSLSVSFVLSSMLRYVKKRLGTKYPAKAGRREKNILDPGIESCKHYDRRKDGKCSGRKRLNIEIVHYRRRSCALAKRASVSEFHCIDSVNV